MDAEEAKRLLEAAGYKMLDVRCVMNMLHLIISWWLGIEFHTLQGACLQGDPPGCPPIGLQANPGYSRGACFELPLDNTGRLKAATPRAPPILPVSMPCAVAVLCG